MLRRTLSLLAASWLAIALVEPAALHVCDMHAGGGAHGAVTAPAEAGELDEHAGHYGVAVHAESPAPDEQAPAGSHDCTCLGECCAVAIASVPPSGQATFAPAAVRREVAFPALRTTRALPAGLRLPFATAPPVLPAVIALS